MDDKQIIGIDTDDAEQLLEAGCYWLDDVREGRRDGSIADDTQLRIANEALRLQLIAIYDLVYPNTPVDEAVKVAMRLHDYIQDWA